MKIRASMTVKICGKEIPVYLMYDLFSEQGKELHGLARFREGDILININRLCDITQVFIHECHHWWRYLTGVQVFDDKNYSFTLEEQADHVSAFICQLLRENPKNLLKNVEACYNLALKNFNKQIVLKEID